MTTDALTKLQNLLRELFQIDTAKDLDFGIYRIMNQKCDEVEEFIERRLPEVVDEALAGGAAVRIAETAKERERVSERIRENFGESAFLPSGELADAFHDTPLGREYLALPPEPASEDPEELRASIFNHLYTYFSRYYDNGDFISRRRYSKRERYAVPYNGEEVHLHWANADQYYVKSGSHFLDYVFESAGVKVRFVIVSARIEHNDLKEGDRSFVPRTEDASYDSEAKTVTIPFEWRPLTAEEKEKFGGKDRQKNINAASEKTLLARFGDEPEAEAALSNERPIGSNGETVGMLAHHLGRYTRKNTSDFFVHKDLGGFLTRELDFYIKNEVLDVDDLLAADGAGNDALAARMETVRAMRGISLSIIAFLAQIEDFQKRIFEKRKFVVSSHYCITLDRVPKELYEEIAANDAQYEEWEDLFAISKIEDTLENSFDPRTPEWLEANPHLVLDTKHFKSDCPESVYFESDFEDRLLSTIEDLDDATDGLLINGDNFQALNLIGERYREQVKCVYIDPPYNSKTSEIIYKNNYKHSSWLTMMENRLRLAKPIMSEDGSLVCAIDENEQERLGRLLSRHFEGYEKICVTVVHNKKGIQGDYFSYNHDFAYFCIPPALPKTNGTSVPESEWEYDNLRKWGRESERETAKNCFYPIFVEDGQIVGFGDVCDEDFHPGQANVPCEEQGKRVAVYPVDSKGAERKWRYARNSVEKIESLLRVHTTSSGEIQIQKAKAEKPIKTVWDDPRYIAGDYGTKWLTNLGVKIEENLYPKSIHTVRDSIFAVSDQNALVADFFAGSGTTGHAVIDLNREDGGSRKYILVEQGKYFDSVMKRRIMKVVYSKEWKDGKPKSRETGVSHMFKYMTLESYEDTLDNVRFDGDRGAMALFEGDEYLLRYMLGFESRDSETFLNVEKLDTPFDYRLTVRRSDRDDGESKPARVDLPETFSYLLGMRVKSRKVFHDGDRRYLAYRGATAERDDVAVIWRETRGWDEADYERDRDFVAEKGMADGASDVFVNGDSLIPGARPVEPTFKKLMVGEWA